MSIELEEEDNEETVERLELVLEEDIRRVIQKEWNKMNDFCARKSTEKIRIDKNESDDGRRKNWDEWEQLEGHILFMKKDGSNEFTETPGNS